MEKDKKAIYAPGELDRLREKLGVTSDREAIRIAKLLGGDVGMERRTESTPPKKTWAGSAGGNRRPKHLIELASEEEAELIQGAAVRRPADPSDDPLIPVKASYFERIKMDHFCALPEFKIKSAVQAFTVMLSFFGDSPDLVNPYFINKKLSRYYKSLEQLVISVRILFPRNNAKQNETIKRVSPVVCQVLDTLRYWNLEKISSDIAKVQAHPRSVRITELSGILKNIYRPLFILEQLEDDEHIGGSFKLLYNILSRENPAGATEKSQRLIHDALIAFNNIRRDLHYCLYPLLMKLLSDCYLPYDVFFPARRNRFMNFIEASESDQIDPAGIAADLKDEKELSLDEDEQNTMEDAGEIPEGEENPEDPEHKDAAQEKEHRAILQGIASLEALFPQAGWERLSSYPDIYPYFRDVYDLRKGYELIAPSDPLLQAVIIIRILEDLLLGLRNVHFGSVICGENGPVPVDETLNTIISDWQGHIDVVIEKEYLLRLVEYCRIIEQSESRASNYAKRLFCELQWIKRLFFLPYYKFDSLFPPPLQKKDVEAVFPAVRSLRRGLALVASGIEQANKIGGAEKKIPCDGIDNPWETYNFAIPNPVSTRLDILLPAKRRNNATLVFFSLAFSTVLDHLLNDKNSWAYQDRSDTLFRTENGLPQFGVDKQIDTDAIFKESVRLRAETGK
jgi:hypothetical protein